MSTLVWLMTKLHLRAPPSARRILVDIWKFVDTNTFNAVDLIFTKKIPSTYILLEHSLT